MPNETFIEYKDKGFWIPESFIEVLSEYICQTFEDIGLENFTENLQEIYVDCDINRGGSRINMVDIDFDNHLTNPTDKAILINVLEQTKVLLTSVGQELTIAILNEFESRKLADSFMSHWGFPIQTQSLIATIDIIEQILNGTWASSNYGVWYKGFPIPDGVTPI